MHVITACSRRIASVEAGLELCMERARRRDGTCTGGCASRCDGVQRTGEQKPGCMDGVKGATPATGEGAQRGGGAGGVSRERPLTREAARETVRAGACASGAHISGMEREKWTCVVD